MKFKLMILLVAVSLAFVSCLVEGKQKDEQKPAVQYTVMLAQWPYYPTVEKLMEETDIVILGKVTGISFQMLDSRINPPDEKSNDDYELNTIYDIEVVNSYKGSSSGMIKLRAQGGLRDVYVEEQLASLAEYAQSTICLMDDMPPIKIGETYLFALHQYEDHIPVLMSVYQSVFELSDPLKKDEFSCFSVKEIISFFGEDKWKEFCAGGWFSD